MFVFFTLIFSLTTTTFLLNGHVIRDVTIDEILSPKLPNDFKDINFGDNITYYSYHIHVYFIQNNVNQTAEATALRNRFLDKFNVENCNDDCETWCPRICHWELNMSPIG